MKNAGGCEVSVLIIIIIAILKRVSLGWHNVIKTARTPDVSLEVKIQNAQTETDAAKAK